MSEAVVEHVVGTVVRLQVQESSLKIGQAPRRYDPGPLRAVSSLTVTSAGVIGQLEDGAAIVDVHHRAHPASKHRGENGISLGFTSHYAAMRDRFGDHLDDGIAGENILVQTERRWQEADLAAGLAIELAEGDRLALQSIVVAAPCVEFTRFALRFPDEAKPSLTVTHALQFLHAGMRGFYAGHAGEGAVVRLGDRVVLAT
jgi:hypothetical protein